MSIKELLDNGRRTEEQRLSQEELVANALKIIKEAKSKLKKNKHLQQKMSEEYFDKGIDNPITFDQRGVNFKRVRYVNSTPDSESLLFEKAELSSVKTLIVRVKYDVSDVSTNGELTHLRGEPLFASIYYEHSFDNGRFVEHLDNNGNLKTINLVNKFIKEF